MVTARRREEVLQEIPLAVTALDSKYLRDQNSVRLDDLSLGSNFDAAIYINNAFDEEYKTCGLTVPESLGWVGFSYGAPQTYGATLRYNF